MNTMNTMNTWKLDRDHSELNFSVQHLMLVRTTGKFEDFNVEIDIDTDNIVYTKFQLEVNINSVNTLHKIRDERIKEEDFFDVKSYPKLKFQSENIQKHGKLNEFGLTGNLTLKGMTKSVKVKAFYMGTAKDSYSGETKMGWRIKGEIDRRKWGVDFNLPFEGDGVAVGNHISLNAELEFKQKEDL